MRRFHVGCGGCFRWGEALVYQYLLSQRRRGWSVKWLNEGDETRAAYDLELTR
jgi:hypothetical protein